MQNFISVASVTPSFLANPIQFRLSFNIIRGIFTLCICAEKCVLHQRFSNRFCAKELTSDSLNSTFNARNAHKPVSLNQLNYTADG